MSTVILSMLGVPRSQSGPAGSHGRLPTPRGLFLWLGSVDGFHPHIPSIPKSCPFHFLQIYFSPCPPAAPKRFQGPVQPLNCTPPRLLCLLLSSVYIPQGWPQGLATSLLRTLPPPL